MSKEENYFDGILEIVGNDGPYQKRFNIVFGYFLLLAVTMPSINIIMALAVPEHWCHVPGRENTNYTMDEWKSMTIPKENNTQGIFTYRNCKMFNMSNPNPEDDIIDCQHGWDYDRTWYRSTVVTQEDWVCDKELHVTNVFVFTKIGDFLGTFIFGQIGDLIGRKPIFFITISILFLGRAMSMFTSAYVWVFAFAALLGNLATPSVFQSPLTIAMEISKNENRAMVLTCQAMGATSALCLLPIIFWGCKEWIPFMLITTLPCGLYLFMCKWIVESPRWLASKHKTRKCIQELGKIAKVNKKEITEDVSIILEKNKHPTDTTYGFMSLFSNWALAKRTILLTSVWIHVNLLYFTLIMNVNNLGGNPFMNYFFQGLAELPASILGKYFCDNRGRRWCHRYGFLAAGISSLVMASLVNSNEYLWISTIIVAFLKFFTTFTFYVTNVHTIELFPTCVRQTGLSFCVITASGVCTLVPYIIYLGTSVNLSYPYLILAGIAALGVLTGLFLSETLNKPLPESLDDAKDNKGRYSKKSARNGIVSDEEIKLADVKNADTLAV